MELRQLATFRAVAMTLSFTRAAEMLHYVQSSVTVHIQTLETELGVPLFDRLGRRIVLTDAGHRLLPYAEQLLAIAEEARVVVPGATEAHGALTISAPESLCTYRLPALLRRFRLEYPHVRLAFRPLPVPTLLRGVGEGELDAAVVLDAPVVAADLVVEPLITEPVWVIAAPTYPLASATRVEPADLIDHPLFLTEAGCAYRGRFLKALADRGVRPDTPVEFGSVEAIKQCVAAGMGLAVLPAMAVSAEVERRQLVALPWEGADLTMTTQLVWRRGKWLSPALQAFLALAREVLEGGGIGGRDEVP